MHSAILRNAYKHHTLKFFLRRRDQRTYNIKVVYSVPFQLDSSVIGLTFLKNSMGWFSGEFLSNVDKTFILCDDSL